MKNRRLLLCVFLFASLCWANYLWAIPAKPVSFSVKQLDGTSVTFLLKGDEWCSYRYTEDGYMLLPDQKGNLCYAYIYNKVLKASSFIAHDMWQRNAEEKSFLSSLRKDEIREKAELEFIKARAKIDRRKAFTKEVGLINDYPTTGSPKALILLVQYIDVKFSTSDPHQAFNDLMNKPGYSFEGATGSAKDYFLDNSGGLFTPEFDVVGPVTLPKDMAYYGAHGDNGRPDNAPWEMVIDGCRLVDEEVDFSKYDNNGDGFVDNVFVFYAGYGENDGGSMNAVWPHAANIYTYYGIELVLDGVNIGSYACTNELKNGSGTFRTGIGTFCHEFSHVLGLPDLYETSNSNTCFTPGYYELMDVGPYNNGGNTPPNMSSFDRMCLKWLDPVELNAPMNVALKDISQNDAYIIKTNRENEFFLFENRQQTGWDTYIPGHGMLIWHIDYDEDVWKRNAVNNNPNHQHVDLVEADDTQTPQTRNGDLFPGTYNVTEFTDESNPKMKTWTGFTVGKPITEIKEKDGLITFKVMGGGERPEKIKALPASDIKSTSFIANWEGNVGIYEYEIDLCLSGQVMPLRTEKTGDVTAYTFTGLTPSTDYYYKVRAVDGLLKSEDSEKISVTTSDSTFDMLQPIAKSATEVESNSFTANWEALSGAEYYILNVYEKESGEPLYNVADFTGSIAGLPEGWHTDCTSTSSLAGYYGKEKPSLRMNDDGLMLESPVFDEDIRSLSFWYRGNKVSPKNSLNIEGYKDGEWIGIATLSPLTNEEGGAIYAIGEGIGTELAKGYRSIRITYHAEDKNSLSLDDVTIGYGGVKTNIYINGYRERNVGNVTSYPITGLKSNTKYYYSVQAYDGNLYSLFSDEIIVNTSKEGAIIQYKYDAMRLYKIGAGNIMIDNTSNCVQPVKVCRVLGQIILEKNIQPGLTAVHLPEGAVYIMIIGSSVYKVAL